MLSKKETRTSGGPLRPARRFTPPLPLFILQPILRHIVRRIGAENPDMFNRLGPHKSDLFVIDPVDFPVMLELRPDPDNLLLRALNPAREPEADARIAGRFVDLVSLMDTDMDGDALFFSRDLEVTGNTEAVVCLRNALDDVEGSIAEMVADMFGPPGRMALGALRRAADRKKRTGGAQ
ncbi:MAG: SCP2 domain-containing protein [Paracoccaceae bacterium]